MTDELDPKYFDENGKLNEVYFKALRNAIRRGQTDIVAEMIEGADVKELSDYHYRGNGYTVLMEAVSSGKEEIIDMLIKKGVDVNEPAVGGKIKALGCYTPFEANSETIAKQNRINRRLLEAGAIDETGKYTKSELVCAVEENNLDKVKELIGKVDVNADNKEGNPLWAKALDKPEMLQTLIDAGLNLETYNEMGHTALIHALYNRDNKTTLALIEAGADVNAKAKGNGIEGHTPLFFAGKELTPVLIDKKADVNVVAADGSTAISNHSSVEKLEALCGAGASLDVKSDGQDLMALAALKQDIEMMKFLQEKGFDINKPDDNGWTPLKYAAAAKSNVSIFTEKKIIIKFQEADPQVVQQMIDMGAKVSGSGALEVVGQDEVGMQIREILENKLAEEKKGLHKDLKMQRQVADKTEERQIAALSAKTAGAEDKSDVKEVSSLLLQRLAERSDRA